MGNLNPLKIDFYGYDNAPDELKHLSSHGGDEDWIVVIHCLPKDIPYPIYEKFGLEDETDRWGSGYRAYTNWLNDGQVIIKDNKTIIIYAHA